MRLRVLIILLVAAGSACNNGDRNRSAERVYKGVYSFGPEIRSFKDCDNDSEVWVTDQSNQLELKYSQLNFEKPYEPVYVEVQGVKVRSGKDGLGSEYDSTLVVKKLIKITREIPQDMCN